MIIPADVLSRDGTASITESSDGRTDFHIDVPWSGVVGITLPLTSPQDGIIHNIAGTWVPEGSRPGQGTVWVDHLSWFSTLANKAIKAFCLTWNARQFVKCLALKLVKQVDKQLALWIAHKLDNSCIASLIASGVYGPENVPLAALEGPCVGQAGEVPSSAPLPIPPSLAPHAAPPRTPETPTAAPPRPPVAPAPRLPTSQPQPLSPTSAPPVEQSGLVNIDPDTQAYGGTVNVWSRPARNDYCNANFPTCDPASAILYQVTQGQTVTALCYRSDGQRIITGTLSDPGYDDRRWVQLSTGGWLPNTWFVRQGLNPALPTC